MYTAPVDACATSTCSVEGRRSLLVPTCARKRRSASNGSTRLAGDKQQRERHVGERNALHARLARARCVDAVARESHNV